MNREIKLVKDLLEAVSPKNKIIYNNNLEPNRLYQNVIIMRNSKKEVIMKSDVMNHVVIFKTNTDLSSLEIGYSYKLNMEKANSFSFRADKLAEDFNIQNGEVKSNIFGDSLVWLEKGIVSRVVLFNLNKNDNIVINDKVRIIDKDNFIERDLTSEIFYDSFDTKGNKDYLQSGSSEDKHNFIYKASESFMLYEFQPPDDWNKTIGINLKTGEEIKHVYTNNITPLILDLDTERKLLTKEHLFIVGNILLIGSFATGSYNPLYLFDIKKTNIDIYEKDIDINAGDSYIIEKKFIINPDKYKIIGQNYTGVLSHIRIMKSLLDNVKSISFNDKVIEYNNGDTYEYDDNDIRHMIKSKLGRLKFSDKLSDFEIEINKALKLNIKNDILNGNDMDDYWDSDNIHEMNNHEVDDISVGQQANDYAEELKQEYKERVNRALDDDVYLDLYYVSMGSDLHLYIVYNNMVIIYKEIV